MRKNKKGFTLVELVIVIAVIAILAAVLLPTFAGIISRARLNSATQRLTSLRSEILGAYFETPNDMEGTIMIVQNDETYHADMEKGNLDDVEKGNFTEPTTGYKLVIENDGTKDVAVLYLTAESYAKIPTNLLPDTDADDPYEFVAITAAP